METDKRLESMEEDLRLMKGEMKQSLASVRDYLLNMELPSSEFATVLAALGADGEQKITMKGSFSNDRPSGAEDPLKEEAGEPTYEEIREEEDVEPEGMEPEGMESEEQMIPEGEEFFNQDGGLTEETEQPREDRTGNQDEYLEPGEAGPFAGEGEEGPEEEEEEALSAPEADLPPDEEAPLMAPGNISAELSQSLPRVNLLANLMHWVTKTKKDIGTEQLPVFLEVYGISGHLSPDLKELILHMAEIASDGAETEEGNTAETWSRAMLSLHGILTGGDAPLNPVKSFWHAEDEALPEEEETAEAAPDQPEDMPLKLKLVLPSSNGRSQEFCLDLKPETVNNGAKPAPGNQECPDDGGDAPWQKQRKRK